jgi:hypothetical protein
MFDRVPEDGSHAILDLGPGTDASLRVYGRFARWIRFADVLSPSGRSGGWAAEIKAIPPQTTRPYDLVFAWNVFNRLEPEFRPLLVDRLREITAPGARLHVVMEHDHPSVHPLRFSLPNTDWMRYEATGPPRPALPEILPAEVERLLAPFRVLRAFTSKVGLREYMAVRPER